MWLYQQKRQHKQHLREMRSYVSEDVQIHRENVKKFEKYFFKFALREVFSERVRSKWYSNEISSPRYDTGLKIKIDCRLVMLVPVIY